MAAIRLKSTEEILEQLRELIVRRRRRYIEKNRRPCPENCKLAEFKRDRVSGCSGCGSRNPEQCRDEALFLPAATTEKLYKEFSEDLRDPEVLLREHRDIGMLLWVLGAFDEEKPVEAVVKNAEVGKKKT
jgi:hypothetical protein